MIRSTLFTAEARQIQTNRFPGLRPWRMTLTDDLGSEARNLDSDKLEDSWCWLFSESPNLSWKTADSVDTNTEISKPSNSLPDLIT